MKLWKDKKTCTIEGIVYSKNGTASFRFKTAVNLKKIRNNFLNGSAIMAKLYKLM